MDVSALVDPIQAMTDWQSLRPWIKRTLLAVLVLVIGVLLVRYHREIIAFLQDREQLAQRLETLGPLGPLGLILLSALQVVFAPIPGYVTQCAGGYLFGWVPGFFYSLIGMAIGGAVAMSLARAYGRPLVQRVVGVERLARWEQLAHLNTLFIWVILMLGFFGDIPYYVAGLTTLAVWKIVLVALIVRSPAVLAMTGVCSGSISVSLDSPVFIVVVVVVIVLGLVATRYQSQLERWIDRNVLTRLSRLSRGGRLAQVEEPVSLEED